MHIVWRGQFCFQLQFVSKEKGVVVLIDPFLKERKEKSFSAESDILLITHPYFSEKLSPSFLREFSKSAKEPFLIDRPGEYEVKNILIQGIPSFYFSKEEKIQNVIYIIEAEGIRIAHLGRIGQEELSSEQVQRMGIVDILMVPVGGGDSLSFLQAAKVVSQVEPKVVIPMNYQIAKLERKAEKNAGKSEGLNEFLKTMGKKSIEAQPKLSIKRKDLPEEIRIVVLKP